MRLHIKSDTHHSITAHFYYKHATHTQQHRSRSGIPSLRRRPLLPLRSPPRHPAPGSLPHQLPPPPYAPTHPVSDNVNLTANTPQEPPKICNTIDTLLPVSLFAGGTLLLLVGFTTTSCLLNFLSTSHQKQTSSPSPRSTATLPSALPSTPPPTSSNSPSAQPHSSPPCSAKTKNPKPRPTENDSACVWTSREVTSNHMHIM